MLYSNQLGIYVIPKLNNIHEWEGIIFIRNGVYKMGKFKFLLIFPQQFPLEPPEVQFVSPVYHPLVDPQNLKLDLKKLLPVWNYGNEQQLYNIFIQIKNMFMDLQYLNILNSYNPQAGQDFNQNLEQFYQNVMNCVEQSQKNIFQNQNANILKFSEYDAVHQSIRQDLQDICEQNKDKSFDEKKQLLLQKLLN
ncbi:Ubiquitin-conjugating enzyme/RWD-like protein [Pseudocohnilembus persalinus]|uniref:Ubiquitin-conjugating enzyme/RWD-like protein n=1 Tax=Pseudocohnilembus persalinus TaxID=266149 RepID=A0A0V0R1H6_PSEPJ|nr:Ubiquitin-conjugating enzyme/RWD-like protein [Pseudocohnilembus persalinus]|eukprot:KRX08347.1 Ubiquitin-conjugating enzyme/RWD-like protein [Pseudocohnilembus persalinus]